MNRSFVKSELSLFSYEILGLVGRLGAGAHVLLRMAKHGRILAWAGESQYYVEPKRLAKLGYLDARREPGKPRERTIYTLTEKGRHRRPSETAKSCEPEDPQDLTRQLVHASGYASAGSAAGWLGRMFWLSRNRLAGS